jgi:hypothetical protein
VRSDWKETDATIASFIVYQTKVGPLYEVVFTYKVDGGWFGGTFTTTKAYRKGDTLPVFYDPKNPDRNNLVRRAGMIRWISIAACVLLVIMAIYLILHPEAGNKP